MDPKAVAEDKTRPTLDTILKELQEVVSETESQCDLAMEVEDILCGTKHPPTPFADDEVSAGKLPELAQLIRYIKERQTLLGNTLGRLRGVV